MQTQIASQNVEKIQLNSSCEHKNLKSIERIERLRSIFGTLYSEKKITKDDIKQARLNKFIEVENF